MKIELVLLKFCRKSFVRLKNEIEKNLEKCTEFYKKMCLVHNKCHISSEAKIKEFPDKYQNLKFVQDRFFEDEQYI